MKDMKAIRETFKHSFQELAKQEHLEPIYEWKQPLFEDDFVLVRWKADHLKKIMNLQEETDFDMEIYDKRFSNLEVYGTEIVYSGHIDKKLFYSEERG